jgi:hypothetical protein
MCYSLLFLGGSNERLNHFKDIARTRTRWGVHRRAARREPTRRLRWDHVVQHETHVQGASTLVYGALGIQLCSHFRAADAPHAGIFGLQSRLQVAQRLLSCQKCRKTRRANMTFFSSPGGKNHLHISPLCQQQGAASCHRLIFPFLHHKCARRNSR